MSVLLCGVAQAGKSARLINERVRVQTPPPRPLKLEFGVSSFELMQGARSVTQLRARSSELKTRNSELETYAGDVAQMD